MKKNKFIVLLFIVLFLVSGCASKSEKNEVEVKSNGEVVDTSKMQHKHCTREATAPGAEVKLNYDIYYTGEKLNILKSEEKVMSSKEETLDTYENAYKQIHSNYEGLEYYDAEVIRGDTTVTSTITINYDNIDIDKLIDIEGEEDNVFENKVANVDKWLELAKKLGTKCELVEE